MPYTLRHFFASPRTRRPLGLSFGELTVLGLSFWYFWGDTCDKNVQILILNFVSTSVLKYELN